MKAMVDGRRAVTCSAFHAHLAEVLHFPAWYGRNLDALYDCLTDLPADTELFIAHFDALEASLGPVYAARLRRVFRDAAEDKGFTLRWETEIQA